MKKTIYLLAMFILTALPRGYAQLAAMGEPQTVEILPDRPAQTQEISPPSSLLLYQ
jgi:hypothetical protein